MRWLTRSRTRILGGSLLILVLAAGSAACDSGSEETDQQIAELEQQVAETQAALDEAEAQNAELQTGLDSAEAELETTQTELETTQAELETTGDELASTERKLADTEAELLDAQLQLSRVGELILADGTYIGPILGAKTSPYRIIVFNAAGNFRAAQVATTATITSGGRERTLSELARLLASTDPDQVELANGNYQVIVRQGLVTSIRKSQA
jgi:hypothetical protein